MKQTHKPEPYLDVYGKKIFKKLMETADEYNLEVDSIAASIMAQQLSIIQRASREINERGVTQAGTTFNRQSPAVKTFNEASSKFLSYASEYGLTVQARKRLFREIEKLPMSDALDRLVNDE